MALLDRVAAEVSQIAQKRFYPYLTRRLGTDDVLFLNWGYEENPPMAIPLDDADEPDRFAIQLYHRTAGQADLRGKDVLEVGCGHGGGASYLTRSLRPASYTGLDLNPAGIAFCRQRHRLPGLEFVQGDAEGLPFTDESFDAVINIESSHCYPRLGRFLAEVARVLRPGGHFLYADVLPDHRIADWEAALASAPMRMLNQRDIGAEVARGVENNSPQMQVWAAHLMPTFLQRLEPLVAPVQDSRIHRELYRGGLCYRMYCFIKA